MKKGLRGLTTMTEDTDTARLAGIPEKIQRKKTTVCIYQDILDRLREIEIVERESPTSIIQRLLEEHDLKSMQKVVAKRVR
jgi:hypothetical protein